MLIDSTANPRISAPITAAMTTGRKERTRLFIFCYSFFERFYERFILTRSEHPVKLAYRLSANKKPPGIAKRYTISSPQVEPVSSIFDLFGELAIKSLSLEFFD